MSNIDGTWDCIVVAPVGKEPHELVLQTGADGTLTGCMTNLKNGIPMDLKDGRVNGDQLTWTMQLQKPFKLTLKVEMQVKGNEMSGHGGTAMLGKAAITGTKRA